MTSAPIGLCFVCLGNICRSPTAEGVMIKLALDNIGKAVPLKKPGGGAAKKKR